MNERSTSDNLASDWDRLDKMSDEDIDCSDIPELDDPFFRTAKVRLPDRKQHVSLRLDPEVLEWFRRPGRGYQTRINAVLRAYVEARKRAERSPSGG